MRTPFGARFALFLLCAVLVAAGLCGQRLASAEVIAGGNFSVRFTGSITPARLPRTGRQPISVSVQGAVRELGGSRPAPLHEFVVAVNRHAHLSLRGLPTCPQRLIEAKTTGQALASCRDALVGTGHFSAHIDIPELAPFPAVGRLLVFNSRDHGKSALLGHVYGRRPIPTARDMYFRIGRERKGPFGVTLAATMPDVGDEWGYVTGFEVTFGRRYSFRGRQRSVLAANCPAPAGFSLVPFKLARGAFYLADGTMRSRVLVGTCRVASG